MNSDTVPSREGKKINTSKEYLFCLVQNKTGTAGEVYCHTINSTEFSSRCPAFQIREREKIKIVFKNGLYIGGCKRKTPQGGSRVGISLAGNIESS